jgi:hypothetical protein
MNLHPVLTKEMCQQRMTNAFAMAGKNEERFHCCHLAAGKN